MHPCTLSQRKADAFKVRIPDIKDGAIWVQQNETKAKLRIAVEGELKVVIDRILAYNKAEKVTSLQLVPMSEGEFRYAFDQARDKAAAMRPDLKTAIRDFQFRDLRAKARTDKEEQQGMEAAQSQLGHASAAMTRQYVRHRKGKLVTPTK